MAAASEAEEKEVWIKDTVKKRYKSRQLVGYIHLASISRLPAESGFVSEDGHGDIKVIKIFKHVWVREYD